MNTASRPLLSGLRVAAILLALTASVLLLGRQFLFQGPYLPVSPLPDAEIVDLHCHVAGIGAGDSGCFISPALRANVRFRIYLDAFGVSADELLQHGDQLVPRRLAEGVAASRHLQAAVLLALDGVVNEDGHLDTNRTEIYVPNEFVAAAAAQHTNLLFGASVNPLRIDALQRLDWAASNGAVLVKWIPSIMGIDPAETRFIPFYQRLREHRLPLLSHTGPERSFTTANDSLADPHRLRLALQHGVRVIAAHAGAAGTHEGQSAFDRIRALMREFPELYADISALTQVNRLGALHETLEAPECRGRLLYGSDFPLINTALVSPWYYPLNLTETQRQKLSDIENPWDRDVQLKQALGVPSEVFARTGRLLRNR